MGISKHSLEIIDKARKYLDMPYKGLKMCEMGCMLFHKGVAEHKTLKEYFKEKGVKHTSIDQSGEYGSVPMNLCKPLNLWQNEFDIITDIGTGEHVHNQFMYFKNCYNLCRREGVMVHRLPAKGHWGNRRIYHYDKAFIKNLAILGGYEILFMEITHLASFVLRKRWNRDFLKKDWDKLKLKRKMGKRK